MNILISIIIVMIAFFLGGAYQIRNIDLFITRTLERNEENNNED